MGSTNEKIGVKAIPEMKFKMTSKMDNFVLDGNIRRRNAEDEENMGGEEVIVGGRRNGSGKNRRVSRKIFESTDGLGGGGYSELS